MKFILSALMIMVASAAYCQSTTVTVSGKIIDSASRQPLEIATITVYDASDTTLLAYRTSNSNGNFKIPGLPAGKRIKLVVTYSGYLAYKKYIKTVNDEAGNLGNIEMLTDVKTMEEVIVHREKPPISINKDTTEYNAGSYKMPPNSMVEDLLKKLPGVSVGADGTVKAQGQQVQKLLVDGKEFFGTDPKMATKNLTSEMIESVQVFDDRSDRSKFTRIDDGTRIKTMNLKLKKGFKNGLFGNAELGYGDQDRYQANAMVNKFGGDRRLSVIFNSNNMNKSGPSGAAGMSAIGISGGLASLFSLMGGDRSFGGGGGVTRSLNTGLNYADQLGAKLSITGDYSYSGSDSRQERSTFRRTTYTDSVASLNRSSFSGNNSKNHHMGLMMNYMIDSSNSIIYRPDLNVTHSESGSADTSASRTSIPLAEYLAVTSRTGNNSITDGFNLTNDLLFMHRFNKAGRTMTFDWRNTISNDKTNGAVYSSNEFYNPDGTQYNSFIQDQRTHQKTTGNNNSLSATYSEPLGTGKSLQFDYTYNNNKSTSNRETFNLDPVSGKYVSPDLSLTNNFINTYSSHRLGTSFALNKKEYIYQFGLAADRSFLRNQSYQAINKKDSLGKAAYTNFFPSFTLNASPGKNKSVMFRYDGRTNQPSVTQLQNVPDATDTLNIRIGNPNLRQEFNHSGMLMYNRFDMVTFRFFSASLNFNATRNKIVNNISVKGPIQTTSYENMNGYYMGNSNIVLGLPLKGGKLQPGSSLNFTNNLSYTRDVSLLSSVKNFTKTAMASQGVNLNLNTQNIDLGFRVNLTYNDVSYTVNKTLNEDYWMQNYSTNLKYNLPLNFVLSTDFNYTITTGRAEGYNQSIPMWNAALIKRLFAKKNAEIRLSVNDILNRNQSITRIASDNFVEDSRTNVLRRYFMLGFFFNLNKMGGPGAGGRTLMAVPAF